MRNHAAHVGVHEGGSAALLAVLRLGPEGVAAARSARIALLAAPHARAAS